MDSSTQVQPQPLSMLDDLRHKIETIEIPPELKENTLDKIARLERLSGQGFFSEEYEKLSHYITWVSKVPWTKRVERPIDLTAIKATLDKNHYGMNDVKERILEYMSVVKLRASRNQGIARAPIICLVGLVGTGKTTFAYSLSEALGRPIARIPFGGLGSAKDLRGESRLHLEAEPGYIARAVCDADVKNPIILLDEIDRVTEGARADIMGVLVELLDPSQNNRFLDHFIDYPLDLSEVMFIATANNTGNLATAVMDRLEPIQMPSYSDEEKTHIAQEYLFPKALEAAGLDPALITVDPSLWPNIIRPLGYDAGIRTLNRTIEGIVRKTALLIVTGQAKSIALTPENIKSFLPKW